jgi:glyoxylase-like metal-dependent hydrolase (beta-lactamase superfamily II)
MSFVERRRMPRRSGPLPIGMHFIERDWLCANHILFAAPDEPATLIDSGYVTRLDGTLAALDRLLGGRPLERLITTHLHSDHVGGNAALAERHPGLRIIVPEAEVPALEAWDSPAQMLSYADQRCPPFAWQDTLQPGDSFRMAGADWEALASPGHDMGSVVLYCPTERLLISADALWENGFGFVPPQAIDPEPLAAQRRTLDLLEDLEVRFVLPGHGAMFRDYRGALARARARLEALAEDDLRIARSVVRGMFIYAMMWRERLPRAELVDYVRRVGVHRDYNAQFFRLSDEAYAEWLLESCVATGQLAVVGEHMISLTRGAAPQSAV